MSKKDLLLHLALEDIPHYVIDEALLIQNLEILKAVKDRTGCKIFLALKAFASYHVFDLIAGYLDGVAASSLNEVLLGHDYFRKEIHTYSPAYDILSLKEICDYSSHVIFNSLNQLKHLGDIVKRRGRSIGIRLNLETSVTEYLRYDPSERYSRFGVTRYEYDNTPNIPIFNGIHIHNSCGFSRKNLKKTLKSLEEKFTDLLHQVEWLNIGGSHYITDDKYDIEYLIASISHLQNKYNLEVYLEPGYAIGANAGYLCAKVLDIVSNEKNTAILNVSPTAHMPDILEMPYRAPIQDASAPTDSSYNYVLASNTCLASDILGEYGFTKPLQINSPIIINNMIVYTMVKTTMFNGIQHPHIMLLDKNHCFKKLKSFDYRDFVSRL